MKIFLPAFLISIILYKITCTKDFFNTYLGKQTLLNYYNISNTSLLNYTVNFLNSFTNETVINNYYKGECENKLETIFGHSQRLIDMYFASGKTHNDWADYTHCISNNLLYVLLHYNYTIKTQNLNKNETKFIGLCFVKECKNYVKAILNSDNLSSYLVKKYDLYLYRNETRFFTKDMQNKFKSSSFSLSFRIIIFIVICYLLIKISISFLGYLHFRKNYAKYSNITISQFKLTKTNNPEEKKTNWLYKLYVILSIRKVASYLLGKSNVLYNDKDLEKFLVIKYTALFGINCYILIIAVTGRAKDLENINLARFKLMPIYKFAYYCYNLYILMAGFTFAYKLLSCVSTKGSSFITFFRFYILSFTRFFIYFFSAFITIYLSKEIFFFFGNYNIADDPYIGMVKSSFNCYVEPLHLILPFYLNYYNPSNFKIYLVSEQCNSVFLLFSTEFYIFTISTILFYIIYKTKSKILEIAICMLPFLFCVFLLRYWDYDEFYTNKQILFSIRRVLKPHSIFVSYFLGIIVGILYFVNNYTSILIDDSVYLPFKFFCNVNRFLHNRSINCLKLTSNLFVVLALSVAFNFNLIVYLYTGDNVWTEDNPFKVKFDPFLNFIHLYEHKLFVLFYAFYLVLLIHRDNLDTRSHLFELLPVSRSSYCILLSADVITGLIYMKNISWIKSRNNLPAILILYFASFIFTCIVGITLNVCFESPFRAIVKRLGKKKKFIFK